MKDRRKTLLRRIRLLLVFFITCLVLSGLTAIPLEWELDLLAAVLAIDESVPPDAYTGLWQWVATVREGLHETYDRYPFIAYGTDWLAFAHVVIAIAFIGPLVDPVRNRWVITFGMIACALVIPKALTFGPLRGIPFYWQLIDCSFGVFGFIPLLLCWRYTAELARSP
jgi:succinate-acetate transporter protein